MATDFLPDADREQAEEALRNKLKKVCISVGLFLPA